MATLPNSPLLIAIVGVNGAGKSTITARLRQEPGFPSNYVNPDEIALTLTDISDPTDRVYTAARKADEQRNIWLRDRQSMAFETVMSHPSKIEFMQSIASYWCLWDYPTQNFHYNGLDRECNRADMMYLEKK
jgi:predicted ABC-type ATPase